MIPQFASHYLFPVYKTDLVPHRVEEYSFIERCFDFQFQPLAEGRLLDIVDNKWREEVLPFDQILVPADKLPDPEADGGDSHLTLSEQVNKSVGN